MRPRRISTLGKRIRNRAAVPTDPPVVAFLERDAERFVWIGHDAPSLAREVHRNATLHVQRSAIVGLHSQTSVLSGIALNGSFTLLD